jgi:hypothetical protein
LAAAAAAAAAVSGAGVASKNQERLFPLMMYINAPDLFSFKSCNFKVGRAGECIHDAAQAHLNIQHTMC